MGRPLDDPLWYKDTVLYELHVRSFKDGNGDGIGDFRGLTEQLDYLEDLGVGAVWLLPFYPSPLRDDGYDIADYRAVHPAYGTLDDFRAFLAASHERGIRVITELVLNHTSDQHPWFQRARRAPRGSPERDFYVWSDSPDRYREARIIFKDFEPSNWTWDPVAQQYYWHRFYAHQPDLNWSHPEVRRAMFETLDFWMAMGVDGMRLDAVPYLFEREGTNCENLPETHDVLRELRAWVDERHRGRMFLAEANQWPEDAVRYFGQGDECHMAFHFPIMPRIFMGVHMEDRFPIEEILAQTPAIPPSCQWALFLRNHDELTLEMVTDEERDYMYRVYARDTQARINLGIRRRLAPLLGNHRRTIELVNGLLFSLPGTPVLYYGDEIGMGDNIYLGDRNGVRTPMQWSADRNAGFSRANPQRLFLPVIIDPEYHYETVNVEAQVANPRSLLWWTKRLIALSRRYRAFGRGSIEFLHPENGKVLAFLRRYQDQTLLVVANLSRFAQYAELDLSAFAGRSVVELFGRTEFPAVGKAPWLITLGPHGFHWFELCAPCSAPGEAEPSGPIDVEGTPETLLDGEARPRLEERLPGWLRARGWLHGGARAPKSARLTDWASLPPQGAMVRLAMATLEFADSPAETHFVPLAWEEGERAGRARARDPRGVILSLRLHDGSAARAGILCDALADTAVATALLRAVATEAKLPAAVGALAGVVLDPALGGAFAQAAPLPEAAFSAPERNDTTLVFGDRWVLRVLRRVEEGVHPDVEVGRALRGAGFPHVAPLAGWLEYAADPRAATVVATVHGWVPNQGDARRFALDDLGRFFDTVEGHTPPGPEHPASAAAALGDAASQPPPIAVEKIGPFLDWAGLLGRRTAALHRALAQIDDSAFRPEPYSTLYQRSLYQSMRNLVGRTLQALRRARKDLPVEAADDVRVLLAEQPRIVRLFERLTRHRVECQRIRCHGNLCLERVLYTGKDFVVTDFDGDAQAPLSERRIKRSPLRDVAAMLVSFHAVEQEATLREKDQGVGSPDRARALEMWSDFWRRWVCSAFVRGYLAVIGPARLIPGNPEDLSLLLECFVFEKTLHELRVELLRGAPRGSATLRGLRNMLRML